MQGGARLEVVADPVVFSAACGVALPSIKVALKHCNVRCTGVYTRVESVSASATQGSAECIWALAICRSNTTTSVAEQALATLPSMAVLFY